MTLVASIIGGSAIGYLVGSGRRGTRLFVVIRLSVSAGQSVLLLAISDDVRDRKTGDWDLAYLPISLAILALGIGLLHVCAALRRRPAQPEPTAPQR